MDTLDEKRKEEDQEEIGTELLKEDRPIINLNWNIVAKEYIDRKNRSLSNLCVKRCEIQ